MHLFDDYKYCCAKFCKQINKKPKVLFHKTDNFLCKVSNVQIGGTL